MPLLKQAKKIAKEHEIKGFRKLRLKGQMYIVGKQCQWMDTSTALSILSALEKIGYQISGKETALELARKGLLDTITLHAPKQLVQRT